VSDSRSFMHDYHCRISIRSGDLYFIAPSAVQKERIQPEDIFVVDKQRNVLSRPSNVNYRPSQVSE
jgi:ribulose-5-phosphate 4-epimerase/fuculose-1-phosphate aldolase